MAYKYNPFTGTLDEVGAGGGGGGTPGGSTTQLQFNDAGAFGGDADLTWNSTTNVMTVTGDVNLSMGAPTPPHFKPSPRRLRGRSACLMQRARWRS